MVQPRNLPTAVIFDLDGTLVDSAPDLHSAISRLLGELGLPPLSLGQVTSFIGEGIPPLVANSLTAAGAPAQGAALEIAVARYKEIYAEAPSRLTRPYAGVLDSLMALQKSAVALGVCTNKSEPLAREVLNGVKLDRLFRAVVGGDTLAQRKPDPAPLLHTLAALDVVPAEAVYVGDSEIDAATAKAAGVRFALFTRGYRKAPVDALPRAADFDEFRDLLEVLEELERDA